VDTDNYYRVAINVQHYTAALYRVDQKTGLFLGVDNFTKVDEKKACDMSKVAECCLEKSTKLACQRI